MRKPPPKKKDSKLERAVWYIINYDPRKKPPGRSRCHRPGAVATGLPPPSRDADEWRSTGLLSDPFSPGSARF